ncbi:hypothetical protein S40285_06457 [Stachybotrys chlorohalonatus IBT 40285]|uniref:RRM domain-containing protein n=1 Tax=Stachybotrys chlorohalonatus (strain IBT 40285) TaxID=1283841 RepID=A0A084QB86_STAC4|nr:hypothetical protein S40285_06457 [Stachybotrys chlorohalonata IBT 40285]
MAPELRKRKSAAEVKKPDAAPAKIAEKAATKGKRKAAEEASPVSTKKQKPVKKVVTESEVVEKPTKSKAKKSKPAKKAEVEAEEPVQDETTLRVSDGESDSEEEEGVQELAEQLDPEDEEATGKELFKPGQDVGKIPEPSKTKGAKADGEEEEPGVIYIGRIPHGFYEHEMRQYFSQFGPVSKLRISRNKKTGASKHFAFVEFAEASTAEIAAKTMDNYLLFGHILKCKVLPKEQVREDLFKGANHRFKKIPWNKMAGRQLEKPLTESAWDTKIQKEKAKRGKQAAKLKALGYDFEAPELKKAPPPPPVVAIENEDKEPKAIEDVPAEGGAVPKKEDQPVEEDKAEEATTEEVPKSISAPKPKSIKGKAGKGSRTKKARA